MTTSAMAPAGAAPLTRQDRCDRCGAAAMLRAVLVSGAELHFCGHHARKHGPRLHAAAARLSIELSETHSWRPAATESWVCRPG